MLRRVTFPVGRKVTFPVGHKATFHQQYVDTFVVRRLRLPKPQLLQLLTLVYIGGQHLFGVVVGVVQLSVAGTGLDFDVVDVIDGLLTVANKRCQSLEEFRKVNGQRVRLLRDLCR